MSDNLEGVTPANTNPVPGAPTTEQAVPVEPETEIKPEGELQLPEVPEEKEEPKEQAEIEPTGNPFVDELLTEFRTNDVDPDKLFGDYLETGNEDSIDFAYLEEKVGKLAAKGLIAAVRAESERMEQEAEQTSSLIYESAGGKEVWDGIINWIASGKSGLTKEGGAAYNDMLAAGGVQATLAARELSNMFKQSPGFTQDAKLQQGDQQAAPVGIQAISRAEYVEQLDAVVRKSGEYSPEAQALHQRRLFTMGNGA